MIGEDGQPKFSHRRAYGENHGFPLSPFWHEVEFFFKTNRRMDFNYFLTQAKAIQQSELEKVARWREEHPLEPKYKIVNGVKKRVGKTHRPKLQPKNLDRLIQKLIADAS